MSYGHLHNTMLVNTDIEDHDIRAASIGLFALMLSYAGRRQSGRIPMTAVRRLPGGNRRNLRPLLAARWIEEEPDSSAIHIRSWAKFNGDDAKDVIKACVRVDDALFIDPDIDDIPIRVGAIGLFAMMLCYASFHRTGGEISIEAVRTRLPGGKNRRYLQSLCTADWVVEGEDKRTFTIKSFGTYNKGAAVKRSRKRASNHAVNGAKPANEAPVSDAGVAPNAPQNPPENDVDSRVGATYATHAESQIPNSDEESRNNNNSNNIVGAVDSDSVAVVVSLASLGVSERVAQALTASHPLDTIRQQIDWLPSRHPDRPAAMIVDAIKGGWDAPVGVVRQADAAQVKAQAQKRGESLKEKTERDEQAVRAEYKARFDALPAGEQSEIMRQAEESVGESRPEFAGSPAKKLLRKQAVTAARNKLLDERAAAMPPPPSGSAPPIVARAP